MNESPGIDFTGFRLDVDSSRHVRRGRLVTLNAALHLLEHENNRGPLAVPRFMGLLPDQLKRFLPPSSEFYSLSLSLSPCKLAEPQKVVKRGKERGNRYFSFSTRNSVKMYSTSPRDAYVSCP